MKVRLRTSTVMVAVASAFLMVFVVPLGVAAASAPELTPGPTYTLWAYGAVRTVDFSGSSAKSYDYQGSATYGYSVVLNQTNLTSSTVELSVNRTMGALISIEYCFPTCRNPSITATVYHHAWESVDAWANFTTNGTVSVNGASVPALALMNSHSTLTGSLVDRAQGELRTSYLSANVSASADVSFATPLGLLPENLTSPTDWNSTSAFTATGAYRLDYAYHYSSAHLSSNVGPVVVSGEVDRSGNVTVLGSTNAGPGRTVLLGGAPYLNVSLAVEGPFTAREGFILLPDQVDLFGGAVAAPVSANETGDTAVQMTSIDVRTGGGPHLGFVGSAWLYSTSAMNPSITSASVTASGVTQVAAGANNVASTPVQGVPIPVGQAQGYQGCLVSGTACPGASSPRALLPGLAVGILAVVVAVIVASVLLTERRRIPPPAYPNAKLYPPGNGPDDKPMAPSGPPLARRPSPPAEDDPLSNLW